MVEIFASKTAEIEEREVLHADISRKLAGECMVLLENDGALPIHTKKVALFGNGARATIKGGTGSGDVNTRNNVNIEQGFQNAVAGADRAIVVTTPEVSAIRDADRIIGLLEARQIQRIDLLINRLRMDMVRRGDMMSVEDVVEILAVNLIGAVPDDETVVVSANHGEPLSTEGSEAGQAFDNICRRITGEAVPLMDLNRSNGILGKLTGFFHRNSQ